ncbi:D-alanine--D-alanine ligase [Patescibacteria group bacterium]
MSKQINLAIIFGGPSREHEVSLSSAKGIIEALDDEKYSVIPILISKSGRWPRGALSNQPIDLILPIGHGSYMEDGKLQGELDKSGLPYLFSDAEASALAMNKSKTKAVAEQAGLNVLPEQVLNNDRLALRTLDLPLVIKPTELGSSVGITIAKAQDELQRGIDEAFAVTDEVLLEKFQPGRELTVGIMGNKNPQALPVIEIIPQVSKFYDYQAKYDEGGSEHVCPAEVPAEITKQVQSESIKVFKAVGCADLARADFIWDDESGEVYFLEINTIPGMTHTSLVPEAAAEAGIEFRKFLDILIASKLNM